MKELNRLLLEIATLYYKEGFSQKDISEKLFFSPAKISRLMRQAIQTGVVEININYPNERMPNYEELIYKKYAFLGLKEVRVLKSLNLRSSSVLHNFGEFVAAYLYENIRDNYRIGVSSGRTIRAAIDELTYLNLKGVTTIQLKGMANQENTLNDDSHILTKLLSEKISHSSFQLLYSPLYIESAVARDCLIREAMIEQTMQQYKQLDIIITSVSYFSRDAKSAWASFISDDEYQDMFYRGTKTSFLGHFISAEGEVVNKSREEKLVGISLEEVAACKNTILIAMGKSKDEAISAALHTRAVKTLLIDSQLAESLIEI